MTSSIETPSILLSMTMTNDSLILIFLSILSIAKIFFCYHLLVKTFQIKRDLIILIILLFTKLNSCQV